MKTYVKTTETKVGNESCYKVTKVNRFRVYSKKLKAWAERNEFGLYFGAGVTLITIAVIFGYMIYELRSL